MFHSRKKFPEHPPESVPGPEDAGISPAALAGRTAGVNAPELAAQHPHLFAQWQNGDLRPSAITYAFDPQAGGGRSAFSSSTQFVGPWVDEACGAREPAVDRWEQGLFYPSWEQLCKLAALTQTPLDTLLNRTNTHNFLGGCVQQPTTFALLQQFHPAIVAVTVTAHPHQPSLEEMIDGLNQAMADIHQQIQDEADPLTLFLNDALGKGDPSH